MPTFEVDDQFHAHPKAQQAGFAAVGLWVKVGSWCVAYGTDGVVPAGMVQRLGPQTLWDKLVEVGMLELTEDGSYHMHDFLHWNRPASYFAIQRARKATNQRDRRARDRAISKTAKSGTQAKSSPAVTGHVTGDVTAVSPDTLIPVTGDRRMTRVVKSASITASQTASFKNFVSETPIVTHNVTGDNPVTRARAISPSPKASPPLAPPTGGPANLSSAERVTKTERKLDDDTVATLETFESHWFELYHVPYPETASDRRSAKQIVDAARQLISKMPDCQCDVSDLIRHWVKAYLDLDSEWLREHKHPIAGLIRDIHRLGVPWATTPVEPVETAKPPVYDYEAIANQLEAKCANADTGMGQGASGNNDAAGVGRKARKRRQGAVARQETVGGDKS